MKFLTTFDYKSTLAKRVKMAYFCRGCVDSWKKHKIMACEMCQNYVEHGWTTEQLLDVYGKQREAMDLLGWKDVMIYPPSQQRNYLAHQEIDNHNALKLKMVVDIISEPHLASARAKEMLGAWHAELLRLAEDAVQYSSFLKQQKRILNLYNMVTTYQTRTMVWEAMDPIVQWVINRVPECHSDHLNY